MPACASAAAAVVTYRGAAVENTHAAHIAVVDARGRLLLSSGDPERVTLPRSAAKPAQALAILESGALQRFALQDADLALMCASHSSEDRHIERARSMLARVGAAESELECGGHPPISEAVAREWVRRGFTPTAVCSNCSGKHVGMLAAARALGLPAQGYHLPGHALQGRVRATFADLCGLPQDAVQWAVDGCNLPTPACALRGLATLFARLAEAAGQAALPRELAPQGAGLARIYRAMTQHPELVAGEGRFCTQLMQAFGGALVGKTGADGCYGLGVRASAQTQALGAEGALGIAVKVEDGNVAVLSMVVCELLERLQLGSADQRARLAAFHRPPMLNTRGEVTGHAEFAFELRPPAAGAA